MKKSIGVIGAITMGLGLALAAPTAANAEPANNGTIYVPDDFVAVLSDTRTNGHYEVVATGLHVYTDANPAVVNNASQDKVAEYIATSTPLAAVGEPTLEYSAPSGGVPGFQLVVDFDGTDGPDGILVGEPGVYGTDWWLNNAAEQFAKDGAPSHDPGSGSANHGQLADWRTAFPNAQVVAFGFSLGSGVKGDGVITAINFAGTRYTFADGPRPVVLSSKDDCKNGGWARSTQPMFKNQGQCVSSFVSTKSKLSNFSI